ncbi:unnamed protein product [Somion occarium]|uniref:Uncharacterized protein n=1 Tax=Somion occarium TaxID=3059160 RepID=A0ABP1DT36_9APHY
MDAMRQTGIFWGTKVYSTISSDKLEVRGTVLFHHSGLTGSKVVRMSFLRGHYPPNLIFTRRVKASSDRITDSVNGVLPVHPYLPWSRNERALPSPGYRPRALQGDWKTPVGCSECKPPLRPLILPQNSSIPQLPRSASVSQSTLRAPFSSYESLLSGGCLNFRWAQRRLGQPGWLVLRYFQCVQSPSSDVTSPPS